MLSEVLYNPDLIRDFEPDDIIQILKGCSEILAKEPALVKLSSQNGESVFVGDTHGDFSTTQYITGRFLQNSDKQYLIFLGDYIDREPEPAGSVWNIVYLCLLKMNFPDRVFLLKGNHEADYAVRCFPYEFSDELVEIFGSIGVKLHDYALNVFRQMPLMLQTANGVIASHSGFPMRGQAVDDKSREDLIIEILWADPEISPIFRGFGIPKFTEEQLIDFLKLTGASCFLRAHDYNLAGRAIYSNRCITVFTCRRYASRAGIIVAKVDLSKKIKDATDIVLEDLTFYLDTSK